MFVHECVIKLTTLAGVVYRRRAVDHAGPGWIEPVRMVGGGFTGATMARAAISVCLPEGVELAVEVGAAGVERKRPAVYAPARPRENVPPRGGWESRPPAGRDKCP